jgi:Tfp pilus assembly protein PilF
MNGTFARRVGWCCSRFAGWLLPALLCPACGCGVNGSLLNGQGVAQFQQGKYDAAQISFQQAMERDPANPDVYYNIARVIHQQGKARNDPALLQQAESYYHRCLDLDGDHQECYRALAVLLLEQDRAPQAFTLLERWGMRSPHLADPKIELARLYQEFNDFDTAKEKLLEALAVDPSDARALAALGSIREKQGETAQALADYTRSLYFNRHQPEVAARVAALQSSGARGLPQPLLPPANSRTVSSQMPKFR